MNTVSHLGLSSSQVLERIQAGKVNTLPPRSGRSTWDIVRANVFTRINFLLLILFILVLSTGSLTQSLFGFLIIVNSGIGMMQELKAKKILDSLSVIGEGRSRVRRDGEVVELARDEVVADDVIEISPGDQVIVDGLVLEAAYLEVDESLLTGESDPVVKNPGDELMSGSHVISGAGAFQATKVGAESYATTLTAEANKFSLTKSELQSGINSILKIITWLLIPAGIVTVWAQWGQGGDWRQIIWRIGGALVPMVPEGLVLLTSLAFAMAVIRLGRQQVLIQELPAVEGLARVNVVCADKTGTLTENGLRFSGLLPVGDLDEQHIREALAQYAGADITPNASMQAITEEFTLATAKWEVTSLAPFTSANKWSGVNFATAGSWVLGAPDVLAAPGSQIAERAEAIGASGQRVLLFAKAAGGVAADISLGEITPQALIVLQQRVRPEAKDTLAYFKSQKVDVKVISGDNAKSVGAVLNSLGVDSGEVVDARTLPENETEFVAAVDSHTVFGRVTPQQKRAMVAALQSKGHNVAMTGDGVNDVLAIKDSDVGVAMGSGSAATRGVAQVVLLNDSFATLPKVVAEGRRVIGNIERVANFFLTKTIYSIILAFCVAAAGIAFPFMPIHISVVGWFTIGVPSFFLALAPNTERARPGFLRRVLHFSIPAGVVVSAMVFLSYLLTKPSNAVSNPALSIQASTAALATLIIAGLWVVVVNARPYRWWKIVLIGLCFGVYVLFFTIPLWLPTFPILCSAECVGSNYLFMLDPTNVTMMQTGIWLGLLAAAIIEALYWIVGKITGERRRFWGEKVS